MMSLCENRDDPPKKKNRSKRIKISYSVGIVYWGSPPGGRKTEKSQSVCPREQDESYPGQVSPTATAPLLAGRSGRIGTATVEWKGLSGRTLKLMLVQ